MVTEGLQVLQVNVVLSLGWLCIYREELIA